MQKIAVINRSIIFFTAEADSNLTPICLCSWKDVQFLGLLKQVTIHPKAENACPERQDTVIQLDTRDRENKQQKRTRYIKRENKKASLTLN